jgi:hypothetical protein
VLIPLLLQAVKKQAAVPAAPQLGLDVELGQQGHASAMPRLPFASGALLGDRAGGRPVCCGLPVLLLHP